MILSVALVLVAIGRHGLCTRPTRGGPPLPRNFRRLGILQNKYYVDEAYGALIVRPVAGMVFLWKVVDVLIIDGSQWIGGYLAKSARPSNWYRLVVSEVMPRCFVRRAGTVTHMSGWVGNGH